MFTLRDSRPPGKVLHPSTEIALALMEGLAATPSLRAEGDAIRGIPAKAGSPRPFGPRDDGGNSLPSNILDLGGGSGLLSLTACALWPDSRVLLTDISAQAVADSTENIENYGLSGRITSLRAAGYDHPEIRARAPYDLILCNLLAELQISLAADARAHLAPAVPQKPGGRLILSGILAWMQPQAEEAHKAAGFEVLSRARAAEWAGIVMG